MLKLLQNLLKKPVKIEMKPEQKLQLEGYDKQFFEKAIKLYIFSRHVSEKHISAALSEQLTYCAHVVYSLFINWLRDGKPSLEYMDFLNTRLNELRMLPEEALHGLEILPHQIDELELMQLVSLRFTDDETDSECHIRYEPDTGLCRFQFSR